MNYYDLSKVSLDTRFFYKKLGQAIVLKVSKFCMKFCPF